VSTSQPFQKPQSLIASEDDPDARVFTWNALIVSWIDEGGMSLLLLASVASVEP
jgi:hypothetical protein